MSWSYGAVHEKGLILKENDFKNKVFRGRRIDR